MFKLSTILDLIYEPELVSKGEWEARYLGLVISVIASATILYADEIFRRNLSYQIQNVENEEPSEREITRRYISLTIMSVLALVMYIVGLLLFR